jgi:glucokinase
MSVIGLDIGGTKLAVALFTEEGEVVARRSARIAGLAGDEVGALAVAELRALLESPDAVADPVRAVGIAVPGIYRPASGTVWAPNIPGWDDYPLRDVVESGLAGGATSGMAGSASMGVPVVRVDSDRACCVLGDAWRGTSRGAHNAIFIAVGTGIGAGILVDGEVLRGARDIGGAIGWLATGPEYRAGYADMGCFEWHASGPGLVRVAREQLAASAAAGGGSAASGAASAAPASHLAGLDPAAITTADVFEAYDAGDAVAIHVMENAIAHWGMAVANLVSVFDPEIIVFGGGVFGPASRFLDRIRQEAERWAQPISMPHVRLGVTSLGADAVLYGAGHLALRALAAPASSSALSASAASSGTLLPPTPA